MKEIRMPLSMFIFWILGSIKIEDSNIKITYRRMFLDFFPTLKVEKTITLDELIEVEMIKSFRPFPIIFGFIIYVYGLSIAMTGGNNTLGMVLVIVGGLITFSGIKCGLVFRNNPVDGGGPVIYIPVLFKERLVKAQKMIEIEKYGEITEKTRNLTEISKREFRQQLKAERTEQREKMRARGTIGLSDRAKMVERLNDFDNGEETEND